MKYDSQNQSATRSSRDHQRFTDYKAKKKKLYFRFQMSVTIGQIPRVQNVKMKRDLRYQ